MSMVARIWRTVFGTKRIPAHSLSCLMRQQQYFDGLTAGDSNMLRMACYKDAIAHGLAATSELLG